MEFINDTNHLIAAILLFVAFLEIFVYIPILKRSFDSAPNKTAEHAKTQTKLLKIFRMIAFAMILIAIGIYMLRPFAV